MIRTINFQSSISDAPVSVEARLEITRGGERGEPDDVQCTHLRSYDEAGEPVHPSPEDEKRIADEALDHS